MSELKLGLHVRPHDERLALSQFLDVTAVLPDVPGSQDWGDRVSHWGMYLNDQIGICGPAAVAHQVMAWTSRTRPAPVVPAESDVLHAYSAVSGYDPQTGARDEGVVLAQLLNYCHQVGIGGDRCDAYAAVNPKRLDVVRAGLFLFGGLVAGVNLPVDAQAQFQSGQPWDSTGGRGGMPGGWGGHAILLVSYDEHGMVCITWGKRQPLTWDWWLKYASESWALLDLGDWVVNHTVSPSGLDLATLTRLLKAMAARARGVLATV